MTKGPRHVKVDATMAQMCTHKQDLTRTRRGRVQLGLALTVGEPQLWPLVCSGSPAGGRGWKAMKRSVALSVLR